MFMQRLRLRFFMDEVIGYRTVPLRGRHAAWSDKRLKDSPTREFVKRLNAVPLHGGITVSEADMAHLERCRAAMAPHCWAMAAAKGGDR